MYLKSLLCRILVPGRCLLISGISFLLPWFIRCIAEPMRMFASLVDVWYLLGVSWSCLFLQ